MLFMRYKAADGMGFTPGKAYFGQLCLESGELVSYDSVTILDDNGKSLKVDPTVGEFEFLDEMYAVSLVDELTKGIRVGDVVTLTGVEMKEDKCFVEIKGIGYRSCYSVLVLDRTNVYPGLTVLDRTTNHWRTITCVNESLWVLTGPKTIYRPLIDFRFAISEGDILIKPYVTCILKVNAALTEGKRYELLWGGLGRDSSEMVGIVDDKGNTVSYLASRFKIW